MFSSKTSLVEKSSQEGANKRQKRSSSTSSGINSLEVSSLKVLKSGIFWDIENIPVKKSIAARRVPEMKKALLHFVTNINHYDENPSPEKKIHKFIAVARQKGANSDATTSDFVKKHLIENEIELLDLPYKSDADYCDDAIYESVLGFTAENDRSLVVALTGDVGLVRRINKIERDFDLIVVMQRAGKKTTVMQRHCDKIKQTNDRGRQQAVYFIDEVIRKCLTGGIPLTFSHLLRLKSARGHDDLALDDDHFRLFFGKDQEKAGDNDSMHSENDCENGSETCTSLCETYTTLCENCENDSDGKESGFGSESSDDDSQDSDAERSLNSDTEID